MTKIGVERSFLHVNPDQNLISIRGDIVPPTECLLDTYTFTFVYFILKKFHFTF